MRSESASQPPGPRVKAIFRGWRVVAAAFFVNAVNDGTWFLGFSIFFLPIARDLNLSRTAASLPFTLNKIIPTAGGPVLGYLIDRAGAGAVLAVSGLLAGLGFLLLRWSHSYASFMIILVGLLSLGMMGFVACTMTAVSHWFVRRRALALSVAHTGFTIGGALIPPALAVGVAWLGWRTTITIVGAAVWIVVLPLATLLRNVPEDVGLLPDGADLRESGAPGETPVPRGGRLRGGGMTVRQALRTRTFWVLSVGLGIQGMVYASFSLHIVAIMTWKGLEESAAGFMVGFFALAMTPAVLAAGWMGDRWPKQRIAAIATMCRALGLLLMLVWGGPGLPEMAVIMVLLAPGEAVYSLSAAMTADLFGRRNYATFRGLMQVVGGTMAIGMPLLAGWVFDATQGYGWLLGPFVGMQTASAAMLWLLPRPRGADAVGT